ncbi:MAG: cobinamide kinase [Lachnospiraceae bacterium]|nr:cobinamide kinase [Lachnospiraceae bacterium]
MMILVTGGSGSGKSAYAEELAVSLTTAGGQRYYLATMQPFGEEGRRRIERHKKLREGKGFLTIEQPTAIHQALGQMEQEGGTALLECLSNLAANEMFGAGEPKSQQQVTDTIVQGVELLRAHTEHLVVVGNNVFEDGVEYDAATMAYIRAMGRIQQRLAAMADRVVEVVVGIPLSVKP